MKIKKQGSRLVITEITPVDIVRLIKINVKLTLTFPNLDGKIDDSNNIELFERSSSTPSKFITLKCKERKSLSPESIDTLSVFINTRKNDALLTEAFIEIRDAENYGPLIEVLPSINEKLIFECAYIDYKLDVNKFTLAYFDLPNKTSNKVLYYEDNNSMLTFTKAGPMIVTDNPGVTSVRDLIC